MSTKLERIYNSLPDIQCKRLCARACVVIPVTKLEREHMVEKLGRDPFPYFEDFARGYVGAKRLGFNPDLSCIKCPNLNEKNECSIHLIRPLICRLFGLVKKLRCPYGCVPERWVSDKEAKRLFAKIGKDYSRF